MDRHGLERVERFLDLAISLDNLIDPYAIYRARVKADGEGATADDEDSAPPGAPVARIPGKSYLDPFLNPESEIARQREAWEKERERARRFPERPEADVLHFLLEHAPLETWQREVLEMVRAEAFYFVPQRMTKIMNEGWATFVHTKILTERALRDEEVVDYADHHSGTVAMGPHAINPYKIGLEIYRDIEDRWDRGAFGRDYDECDDLDRKRAWDRRVGLGRQKVFEVRRIYNDVTFLDAFFTEDFCRRHRFFTFRENPRSKEAEIASRDFERIKDALLFQLTNLGQPRLVVQDANHRNRGELYLLHEWNGADLQVEPARDALRNVQAIWGRPVHLEAREGEKTRVLTFDGKEISTKEATPSTAA
jgi:stage V sporulation protein R